MELLCSESPPSATIAHGPARLELFTFRYLEPRKIPADIGTLVDRLCPCASCYHALTVDAAVDVWFYDLASAPSADAVAMLSPFEQCRAAAFVRVADRDRFVAAHEKMRSILGEYLRRDPREIEFEYGPQGRPSIARSSLDFNLSHSEDRAVLVVGTGVRIGVDLEHERENVDTAALVQEFFAPEERARFASVNVDERQRWFYRQWVAKEAVLKAHGGGLSVASSGFAVRFESANTGRVRSGAQDPGEQWIVRMLSAGRGWHAAAAVNVPLDRIRFTLRDRRRCEPGERRA